MATSLLNQLNQERQKLQTLSYMAGQAKNPTTKAYYQRQIEQQQQKVTQLQSQYQSVLQSTPAVPVILPVSTVTLREMEQQRVASQQALQELNRATTPEAKEQAQQRIDVASTKLSTLQQQLQQQRTDVQQKTMPQSSTPVKTVTQPVVQPMVQPKEQEMGKDFYTAAQKYAQETYKAKVDETLVMTQQGARPAYQLIKFGATYQKAGEPIVKIQGRNITRYYEDPSGKVVTIEGNKFVPSNYKPLTWSEENAIKIGATTKQRLENFQVPVEVKDTAYGTYVDPLTRETKRAGAYGVITESGTIKGEQIINPSELRQYKPELFEFSAVKPQEGTGVAAGLKGQDYWRTSQGDIPIWAMIPDYSKSYTVGPQFISASGTNTIGVAYGYQMKDDGTRWERDDYLRHLDINPDIPDKELIDRIYVAPGYNNMFYDYQGSFIDPVTKERKLGGEYGLVLESGRARGDKSYDPMVYKSMDAWPSQVSTALINTAPELPLWPEPVKVATASKETVAGRWPKEVSTALIPQLEKTQDVVVLKDTIVSKEWFDKLDDKIKETIKSSGLEGAFERIGIENEKTSSWMLRDDYERLDSQDRALVKTKGLDAVFVTVGDNELYPKKDFDVLPVNKQQALKEGGISAVYVKTADGKLVDQEVFYNLPLEEQSSLVLNGWDDYVRQYRVVLKSGEVVDKIEFESLPTKMQEVAMQNGLQAIDISDLKPDARFEMMKQWGLINKDTQYAGIDESGEVLVWSKESGQTVEQPWYQPYLNEQFAKDVAIGVIPIAGTMYLWDRMQPWERGVSIALDVVTLLPFVGAVSAGVRAGKSVGVSLGRALIAEAKAPVMAIAHPIATAKTAISPFKTLLKSERLPLAAAEIRQHTVKIPVQAVGEAKDAMAARDALMAATVRGEKTAVQVAGKNIELTKVALQQKTIPALVHTTPDVRWVAQGAVVDVGREGGLFVSPSLHTKFAGVSAYGDMPKGGMPGAIIIRDEAVLNKVTPSGKIYRGTAEVESVLPSGIELPPPSQYLKVPWSPPEFTSEMKTLKSLSQQASTALRESDGKAIVEITKKLDDTKASLNNKLVQVKEKEKWTQAAILRGDIEGVEKVQKAIDSRSISQINDVLADLAEAERRSKIEELTLAIIGKPLTRQEINKLKIVGATDTVRDIFRPALKISGHGVDELVDVGTRAKQIDKDITLLKKSQPTVTSSTVKLSPLVSQVDMDRTLKRFANMSDAEFKALAKEGVIAPYGGGDKIYIDMVAKGTKPIAMLDKLPIDVPAAYAKLKGLKVEKYGNKWLVVRKGNEKYIDEFISLQKKYGVEPFFLEKLPADESLSGMNSPIYHLEFGKLMGYSDADIARYLSQEYNIDDIRYLLKNRKFNPDGTINLSNEEEILRLQAELRTLDARAKAQARQIDLMYSARQSLRPIGISVGDYIDRVNYNELARTNPTSFARTLSGLPEEEILRILGELEPEYRSIVRQELNNLPDRIVLAERVDRDTGVSLFRQDGMQIERSPSRVIEERVERAITPERVPGRTPTRIPTRVPERVPTTTTRVPSRTPDRVPTRVVERVPTRVPERTPERVPERTPTRVPTRVPERIPERIPERPPYRVPPSIPPVVPPPPVPPVIPYEKVASWEDLSSEQQLGSIVWKQGWYYWAIYPPYGKRNVIGSLKPFPGVKVHRGPRSAYKSVAKVKGSELPERVEFDLGIQDIIFEKDKTGNVRIHYEADPRQETTAQAPKGYPQPKVKRTRRTVSKVSTVK